MRTPRRSWPVWILFFGYCLMLLWLLLFQRIGDGADVGRFNLQPFETIRRYLWVLRHSGMPGVRNNARMNLLGNVLLLVPMGVFLPLLFAKLRHFCRFLLLSVLMILVLEYLQAATGLGTFDVDDFILNFLGIIMGFLALRIVGK